MREVDAFEEFLLILACGTLVYVGYCAWLEWMQPSGVFRLRDAARRIRNALIGRTDIDPDVAQLLRRLDYRKIYAAGDTATIGKRGIRICMVEDTRFSAAVNEAIRTFALLHEIAHVMTPEYGHGENFWQNFRILLRTADAIGVLNGEYVRTLLALNPTLCAARLHVGYMP